VGNLFEQSIVLKTNDRFPDRGATAAQLLADDVFADFFAGFQIELQNGPL
jgi:hypothetical protein